MATKGNKSIDAMLAEAETKIRSDLKEISGLIRRDFREVANSVLVDYYRNYTPRMYVRTSNLMHNAINDDMVFDDFIISGKDSYGAWVHFNSYDMDDYEMGNKEAVLKNFMEGIHGRPSIYLEKNPAISIMEGYQRGYKNILDGYFASRGFTIN